MVSSLRNRQIKTTALVLQTRVFQEHGKIITFLTPDLGKITAFARSARKLTSPLIGKLEALNLCNVELYKSTRQSYTLVQCDIIEHFENIKKDLTAIEIGLHIVHMISAHINENEDTDRQGEIFHFILETFETLEKKKHPHLTLHTFTIKLFDLLGLLPSMSNCTECHARLTEKDFSKPQNILQLCCENCNATSYKKTHIPVNAMKIMKFLTAKSFTQVHNLSLKTHDLEMLKNIVQQLVHGHALLDTSSRITRITPFTFSSWETN